MNNMALCDDGDNNFLSRGDGWATVNMFHMGTDGVRPMEHI
jgi:hypothetical protein